MGEHKRLGMTFRAIGGNNEEVFKKKTISGKKAGNAKREPGDSNRVIVGNSDNGGAANANWDHPDNSNDNIGFRVAVVLSLKKVIMYGLLNLGWAIHLRRCFNPATKHFAYLLYERFKYEVSFIIKNF